jgi:hypothetical protein
MQADSLQLSEVRLSTQVLEPQWQNAGMFHQGSVLKNSIVFFPFRSIMRPNNLRKHVR